MAGQQRTCCFALLWGRRSVILGQLWEEVADRIACPCADIGAVPVSEVACEFVLSAVVEGLFEGELQLLGIVEAFWLLVDERLGGGDVEGALLAVAGQRGVAPLAVGLLA